MIISLAKKVFEHNNTRTPQHSRTHAPQHAHNNTLARTHAHTTTRTLHNTHTTCTTRTQHVHTTYSRVCALRSYEKERKTREVLLMRVNHIPLYTVNSLEVIVIEKAKSFLI